MKDAYLRTAAISKKNMSEGKGVMSKMNATARGSVNNGASAKAPVNNGASAKAQPRTAGEFIANNFNTVLNDQARRAGVAVSTLYAYAPSLVALLSPSLTLVPPRARARRSRDLRSGQHGWCHGGPMCGCLLTLPPSSVGATAGKYGTGQRICHLRWGFVFACGEPLVSRVLSTSKRDGARGHALETLRPEGGGKVCP